MQRPIIPVRIHLFLLCMLIVSLGCGSDDTVDNTPDPEVEEDTGLVGDYKGTWNSTTASASFTNIGISARLEEVSEGEFRGPFFISRNFTSCCNSGDNDGIISLTVEEDSVTSFRWDDIIPGCTGTFVGSGLLVNEERFVIEITGRDCDGDHEGSIVLTKQ